MNTKLRRVDNSRYLRIILHLSGSMGGCVEIGWRAARRCERDVPQFCEKKWGTIEDEVSLPADGWRARGGSRGVEDGGYLRYHLRSWQTTGLIKSLRPFYKKSLSNMPVSLQTQSGPIGPPDWNSSAKDLCERNGKQAGQLRPDRTGEIPLKIESGFNSSKKCSENRLWLVAM